MGTTVANVGSRFVDGKLEFFSKVSGDTLATLDPDNDLLTLGSGGALVVGGPFIRAQTVTDIDAQNGTLTAAMIRGGIVVHTSVTGGGTLTTDTGALIAAGIPELNVAGRSIDVLVINDGDQTVTLAAGASGVTLADAGQTIATNESVLLRVLCTADATFTVYTVGA